MLASTALKLSRFAVRPFASFGDQLPNAPSQVHNKEMWGMEMQKKNGGSSPQDVPGNPGGNPGKRNQRDDPTNAFTGVKGVKYNIQENDMDDGSGGSLSKQEQQVMADVNQAEKLRDEDPVAADEEAKKKAAKDHIREDAVEAGEPTKQDGKSLDQMRPDLRGGHQTAKEGPSITFPETMATPRDELKHY